MVTWIGAAVAIFAIALAGSALLTLRLVRKAEADYPPAGGSVDVEGLRLHYLERGRGRPVILIHGLSGSAYDFEVSISEGLARDHRVVAFDRPGNGYSDQLPDERQSLFVEARQLHAAALKLGLERPLLVGYSLGAAVAIAYADAYPEDVAGVVTIAGHVMPCRAHVGPLAFFAGRPLIAGVASNTLLVPVGRLVGRMAPQAGLLAAAHARRLRGSRPCDGAQAAHVPLRSRGAVPVRRRASRAGSALRPAPGARHRARGARRRRRERQRGPVLP